MPRDRHVADARARGAAAARGGRALAHRAEEGRVPLAFIELDREFHRAIVRAANNPILADFYESLRDRQTRMGLHAIATSERRMAGVLAEHKAIAEGVRSGDAERAAASMAAHLAATMAVLRSPDLNYPGLAPPEKLL